MTGKSMSLADVIDRVSESGGAALENIAKGLRVFRGMFGGIGTVAEALGRWA